MQRPVSPRLPIPILPQPPRGPAAPARLFLLCFYADPNAQPDAVTLRLWLGQSEVRVPMQIDGVDERGWRRYVATVRMPTAPGWLWYYFIVDRGPTRTYYGNNPRQPGRRGRGLRPRAPLLPDHGVRRAFEIPRWLREGVIYHICGPLLRRGGPRAFRALPADYIAWETWGGTPFYHADPADKTDPMDHFGGNLKGTPRSCPTLADLGVTILYLSPIFEAHSTIKYNTADYLAVDPAFGTAETSPALCRDARALGIRVILTGCSPTPGRSRAILTPTGATPDLGAHQSPDSPYYPWYRFRRFPDDYESWWAFPRCPRPTRTILPSRRLSTGGRRGALSGWAGGLGLAHRRGGRAAPGLCRGAVQGRQGGRPRGVVIGEVGGRLAQGELRPCGATPRAASSTG